MIVHYAHTHGFDGFFADKVLFEYRFLQSEIKHHAERPLNLAVPIDESLNKMRELHNKERDLNAVMMWALGEVDPKYREEESVRSLIYRDDMERIQSLREEYRKIYENGYNGQGFRIITEEA